MRDFNIDTLKSIAGDLLVIFLTILSAYGLQYLIKMPTREEFLGGTLVSSSSCVDPIIFQAPDAEIRAAENS